MNKTQKIQAFILVLTLAVFASQTKGQVTVSPNWVGTLPATCSPAVRNKSLFYRYTTSGNGRGYYFCNAADTFEKLIFGTGTTNFVPYFSATGKVASSPFGWDGST